MAPSVWVEQAQLLLLFVVLKGGAGHGNGGQRAFKEATAAVFWL
jgi:hypothetical protein